MWDISYASVLMAGEVPVELRTLLEFGFELQLDEFFNRLWASIRSVVAHIYIENILPACLVDSQGSDWRPFVHAHDLSGTIRCEVRLNRLRGGRIKCHF